MPFFTKAYLDFFEELSQPENNNKDWFDDHRRTYDTEVRDAFKDFAFIVASKIQEFDPHIDPSPYIYRINNDLRFQPDKVPYKLFKTASFSPAGNAVAPAGYYLQISSDQIHLGGGLYEVTTKTKNKVREYIADHLDKFQELVKDSTFTKYYNEIQGAKNKRLPKSIQPAAEKEPLLYNTQWYYITDIPAELILSDKILDELIKRYKAIYEINKFFRNVV